MTQRPIASCSLLLLLLLSLLSCGSSSEQTSDGVPKSVSSESGVESDALAEMVLPESENEDSDSDDSKQEVTLYWPSLQDTELMPATVKIFKTAAEEDTARQILANLLNEEPPKGAARAVPAGTTLRQVYIYNRTAYVNLSQEVVSKLEGGSARELMTVYSIVDSLVKNLSQVDRVSILVEGKPVESLNGHVDLTYPLTPRRI